MVISPFIDVYKRQLVDEINRAPAKTQAALFEVMEERQVSIDGTTHQMGELYTILATQNPLGCLIQTTDYIHQCRFTRTGRSHDGYIFAFFHRCV